MPLEFIQSQRGACMLLHKGYLYYKRGATAGKVSWRCTKYTVCEGKCTTTSATPNGEVLSETGHNHGPDSGTIEARRVQRTIQHHAHHSNQLTSTIVEEALSTVSALGAGRLPSRETLCRSVRRVRRLENPLPPNPSTLDFVVPERFTRTKNGELFLMYDIRVDRMLVFSTERNLLTLKNNTEWFADGTFKVVPTNFLQLYTIHAVVQGKVLPLVYILLSGKSTNIYKRMLDGLKLIAPDSIPTRLIVDFELAFINAFKEYSPTTVVRGCFFHFGQCVYRKIVDVGLQERYVNDAECQLYLKMLCALAYVPEPDVFEAFNALKNFNFFLHGDINIQSVIEYFERTWIGPVTNGARVGALYPISLWNHYESVINNMARTNNSIEGWHHGFSTKARAAHVDIWKLIELLQTEQGATEFTLNQLDSGLAPAPQKKKYRDIDARIKQIVSGYKKGNEFQYLSGLASILKV